MMLDRTAVEAVNYQPKEWVRKEGPLLHQLVGDLRSYQTTIQLAVETLAARPLTGGQAEQHLARIYAAIAQSNQILTDIKTLYGDF